MVSYCLFHLFGKLSMQLSEENRPYTLVTSQRPFHQHENPLFAFLFDQYVTKKYEASATNPRFNRMVQWHKDGREALFFHQAFVLVDFPIFQNFDLNDLHLSIDYKLSDIESNPQRQLPPHHASLVYLNSKTKETIRVRIEYTERGNSIYAKLVNADSSQAYLSLSVIQKEHLLIQAKPAQQLLAFFLQASQQVQYQLLLDIDALDNQLRISGQAVKHLLQRLIERLTSYSRYSGYRDGRLPIYQDYLARLDVVESPTLIQITEDNNSRQVSEADISTVINSEATIHFPV